MTPTEAADTTAIPVLEIGRTWMMRPESNDAANEMGLGGAFGYWTIGRAGALGEVSAEVARSAIGIMAPELVAKLWSQRPEGLRARQVAESYAELAAAWGRSAFAEIDSVALARCAALAKQVTGSASASLGALFAAWRTIPVPDDPAGAATVELQVLREMRGGAHLAAVNALGIGPLGAIIAAPDQVRGGPAGAERFGWQPPLPEPDFDARAEAERLTTVACVPAFEGLSAAERGEFAELVLELRAALDG